MTTYYAGMNYECQKVCPECWAIDTLHDPFPAGAVVAPCLEHVVHMGYCFGCGNALDEDLRCGTCWSERLLERADMERKARDEDG